MRVAIYGYITKTPPGATSENKESALWASLRAAGHKARALNPDVFNSADLDKEAEVVLVVGERGPSGAVAATYRSRGVPVGIMDLPVLRFLEGDWCSIFPHRVGYVPDVDADGSRYLSLPKVSAQAPCRPPTGNHVVILGQLPYDRSHGLDEEGYWAWVRDRMDHWKEEGLEVRFRPHPLMPVEQVPAWVGLPCDEETLEGALRACIFAETYGSSAQYEATEWGVPNMNAGDDAPAVRVNRLHSASWCTWSLSELADPTNAETILRILTQGVPTCH